jgi:hypothetical protein
LVVFWKTQLGLLLGLVAGMGCRSRTPSSEQAAPVDSAAPARAVEPQAPAQIDVDAGETGVMITATRYETLILNRPELKRDVLVDGKEVVRLGILRKGAKVFAKSTDVKGGHCTDGWFQLVPSGGWVCARHVTTDAESKELKDAPHTPFTDKPLPYDYGLNLTHGTPQYRRPPLRKERAANEGYYRQERAPEAAAEAGGSQGKSRPRRGEAVYLSDDPQRRLARRPQGRLAVGRAAHGARLLRRLDRIIYPFAGKMWRSTREATFLRSPPRAPVGHRLRKGVGRPR